MGFSSQDIARFGPAAQKKILDALLGGQAEKENKYHNTKDSRVTKNGAEMKFDSKREARRFDELLFLQAAGKIFDLRLQEEFTLQEAYTTPEGERIRAIRYRSDFTYYRLTLPDSTGTVHRLKVVEDAKGRRTDVYKMKKKMMKERLGIDIQEV